MPACYCKFANCNGRDRPSGTLRYHRSKDVEAELDDSMTCDPPTSTPHISSTSTSITRTPSPPVPTNFQSTPPLPSLAIPPSSSFLPLFSPPPPSPPSPPSPTLPSPSQTHTATVTLREDAEESGRVYIEQALARLGLSGEENVGDLDEDGDGDADLDRDPELRDVLAAGREMGGTNFGDSGSVENQPDNQPALFAFSTRIVRDPAIPDENLPDPFQVDTSHSTSATITRQNTSTPIFLLYLLVSWLHTHFHLPFLACNAVLIVVLNILRSSGVPLPLHPYRTLASVTLRLGVEPIFQTLPVCSKCLEVHPAGTPTNTNCSKCDFPLYKSTVRHNRRAAPGSENHRPHLQFPMKSIEAQLREILVIPGMEDVMEQWRVKQRTPDVYRDNFDGEVCKTIPGADGRPFFENPPPAGCTELRIGLSLGIDWCVNREPLWACVYLTIQYRFSYLRSQIAPSHSSCPMNFNIINLPPHLRLVHQYLYDNNLLIRYLATV